jgi:hypothetical protein
MMSDIQETIGSTVHAVASKVTGSGSAITVVSWYVNFDWGLWLGLLIGLAGLVVNWYFKRQENQRMQEEHDAKMVMMQDPS